MFADWQPGVRLTLAAEEGCWSGRPFVDAIEIEMGKNARDQLIALELGKVEIAEIAAEQAHRVSGEFTRVVSSAPVELLTLVFSRERQSADDGKLREALALSVDRASIRTVVCRTQENRREAFAQLDLRVCIRLPHEQNLARARQERSELQRAAPLGFGLRCRRRARAGDRRACRVECRDAGLILQTTTSSTADLRVARIDLASVNPATALAAVRARCEHTRSQDGGTSVEDLYQAEEVTYWQAQRLIPLFQLPVSYALNPAVRGSSMSPDGDWHLAGVWLEKSKP